MGNGYAKTVLMNRIIDDISAIGEDKPNDEDPHCSTRPVVKRALGTLLEVKLAEMQDKHEAENSIKIGNVKLSGTLTVISAAVVYVILKVHGVM